LTIYVPGYFKKYKSQKIKVEVGKSSRGKPIYFSIRKYGVTPIIARSRAGKTNIVKIILGAIGNEGRRLIIFDVYRDYVKLGKMNVDSDVPISVPNIKVVGRFAFPISEFQEIDYLTLGFPKFAAGTMAILGIQHKRMHQDDPERFYELLQMIPSNHEEKRAFAEKFGFWTEELFSTTKKSMLKRFEQMKDRMIYDPNGTTPYIDAKTIQEYALKYNLIFDMYEFGGEEEKLRVYVGMILRMLRPTISKIKPLMVLEEFDKLCPLPYESFVPSSFFEIRDYAIKLQRHGIHILAITQNQNLINPSVMENWHQKLQGKVAYKDQFSDNLKFYEDFNVREFAIIDANNKPYVFNPPIAPCGY